MDVDKEELLYKTDVELNRDFNLKYVQSEELELTWKAEKRERMKQREQRIWEQFVQEKDIVGVMCKDDPYQFKEDVPESYLLELLEKELQNIQIENIEVDDQSQEYYSEESIEVPPGIVNSDVDNVFYMYHDKDDESDREELNKSVDSPPCTVREAHNESDFVPTPAVTPRPTGTNRVASKSSDNVSSIIENSVYCLKIKELQNNINKEAIEMISFLEAAVIDMEAEDAARLARRSAEFGVRLNRHVYQLQRQLRDIERHAALTAGGARHTRARALGERLASLLQSALHAVQAVGRLVRAGGWCGAAGGLLAALRASAAPHLYHGIDVVADQNIPAISEQLDAVLSAHAGRVAEYMNNITTLRSSSYASKKSSSSKKRFIGTWAKNNTRAVDQRLSMYSLDAPRPRRAHTARTSLSGTSKSRVTVTAGNQDQAIAKDTLKKTNAKPRMRRHAPADPQTLVEEVELNSLSQPATPRLSARSDVPPLNIATPKTNKIKKKPSRISGKNADDKEQEKKPVATDDHGDKVADESVGVKEVPKTCRGDGGTSNDCGEGPKNVLLVCVESKSPPKSTPREKVITVEKQIKSPKEEPSDTQDNVDKLRMTLDVPDQVIDKMMRYKSNYMQYMLNSALYANSSLGKPLKMISGVSEKIVDDLLLNCVKEMELTEFTEELYKSEMS